MRVLPRMTLERSGVSCCQSRVTGPITWGLCGPFSGPVEITQDLCPPDSGSRRDLILFRNLETSCSPRLRAGAIGRLFSEDPQVRQAVQARLLRKTASVLGHHTAPTYKAIAVHMRESEPGRSTDPP